MAWIKVIKEPEATGRLRKIYQEIRDKRGKIAHVMEIQSLNPKALKAHLDLYMSLMFERSGLSRQERELIGIVVSLMNGCQYCVHHHAEALHHYWKDRKRLKRFLEDFRSIPLSEKTSKMLEYAVKLTKHPSSINQRDIATLRQAGYSDEDILHINLITSYFNFVNRLVEGLGVKFNSKESKGYRY